MVFPLAMGICFAGVSPSLQRADFESNAKRSWQGPWGGGIDGGHGGGEFAKAGNENFSHSPKYAARLDTWDDGSPKALAWSCLRQRVRCSPGGHMKAGVWIYSSSSVAPLASSNVTVQLRVEYFSDDDGDRIIPTDVVLSRPFGPAFGDKPDEWHRVFVSGRVPDGAKCLGLSIVLMVQKPGSTRQSIWVDDADLELSGPGRANQPVPRGKVVPDDFPWWKQLFGP
ncbi:MAG TPA: hypothetical protein VIH35_01030 [Kiritimatiellia bacterium]